MKTINFELSKRLNDLCLLDNIETEYVYTNSAPWDYNLIQSIKNWKVVYEMNYERDVKTLTLGELPKFIYDIVWKEKLNKYLNSKYSALQIFNFSVNDYEKIINDLILNQK